MIVADDNQPIEEYKLHGRTITDATEWIRSQIKSLGVTLRFTPCTDIMRYPRTMSHSESRSMRARHFSSKSFRSGSGTLPRY